MYAFDAPAFHGRRETPPHGFDFGQLRHDTNVAARETIGYLRVMRSATEPTDPETVSENGVHRADHETGHASLVRGVFDSVAPRYDLMNDLMSAGLHRLWKSRLIDRAQPRPGMTLVDVAGGTGDVARKFLARGGGHTFICDVNERMLTVGRDRWLDRGRLPGCSWLCADAAALPVPDAAADVCTIAFGLRNVTRRREALGEMRRILKTGGHFLCLEFSPAVLPPLKPLYDAYSWRILPFLGEQVAGDRDAYLYLVESIRAFPNPDDLAQELRQAGFGNVSMVSLSGGIAWIHSGWRL